MENQHNSYLEKSLFKTNYGEYISSFESSDLYVGSNGEFMTIDRLR